MKRKKLFQGAALAGAAALAAVVLAPAAAYAADDLPTFDTDNAAVFVGWGSNDQGTQLSQAELADDYSGFELTAVGPRADIAYNTMAFNPDDGYLYATDNSSGHLLRIGSDGSYEDLGAISGAPSSGLNQGTFGLGSDAGKYYVRTTTGTSMWVVDIADGAPYTATAVTLSRSVPNVSDIVYRDGYIWGYNGTIAPDGSVSQGLDNLFWRIDPSTGEVDTFSAAGTGIDSSQPYGGQWLYGNGNLGLTGNDDGHVYQIAITNGSSDDPTFTVVSQATGQPTTGNDAASILGLPADLAIKKTGAASFHAGDPYSYTITVTNNGEGNSSGSVVTDNLPAGLENPTVDGDNCTITGSVLKCNVGPLTVGQSYDFDVSGVAADDATEDDMVNSASVLGNEADPNPDNNNAEFGPVTSAPSFTLTKDASPTTITPNDKVVHYTFVVKNTGNVPLSDVTVTDPGPVGGQGKMGPISCESNKLAVGASTDCAADYTLGVADYSGDPLKNEATATAQGPYGTELNATAPATAVAQTVAPDPELTLKKTASGGPAETVGQDITYKFKVTNTGNVDVNDVKVTEGDFTGAGEMSAIKCPADEAESLAVGDSLTCTATYTVLAADLTGDDIDNTAVAAGDTRFGPVESDPSAAEVPTVVPEEITPPVEPTATNQLAETGSQSMLPLGGIALLLLAAGVISVMVVRRKTS